MASADMCEHDWPGSGCKECFPPKVAAMLKPCPFCGGEASVIGIRDGRQVSCKGQPRVYCFAKGPAAFHGPGGWDACEADAIAAWNARAPAALPQYADWLPDVWDAYLRDLVGWEDKDNWAMLPATFRWREFHERLAQAIEARRAETLGSVHESAVRQDAPGTPLSTPLPSGSIET